MEEFPATLPEALVTINLKKITAPKLD